MVVEHVFITTLEAPEALQTASQFLARRGFSARPQEGFAMGAGGAWNVLEMVRGTHNPRKAKSVLHYPQTIRLEWDRGRVTVAASSTSYQEARSDYLGRRNKGKSAQWQQQVLVGLVTHLQHLLEGRVDPDALASTWTAQEDELHDADRRRRRRNVWLALVIVTLFVGALVALVAVVSNSR